MAKSISDEELQLRKRARRRLVGAIALVTVVAVFLPMVLDHEPKPVSQDVNIKIPSPDAGVFTSKIVPAAPGKSAPAKNESPTVTPTPPESPKTEAPKTAAAPAPPAEQTPPAYDTEAAPPKKAAAAKPETPAKAVEKPAPAAEKPKAADKAKDSGAYVVQVGALSDPEKARHMRDQIAGSGLKAYTEVVPTSKGNVTRVRAGPFSSKSDAEKARDKLKALGLAGNVVPK